MPPAKRSQNAQLARQPTEIPDHVADELLRYNDHLREMRGLTAHAWLIDFLTTLKLCRAKNQGPALQMGGWRTPPVVAQHNRFIYIIGQNGRWPEALNRAAIRRLPAFQAFIEVPNVSTAFW